MYEKYNSVLETCSINSLIQDLKKSEDTGMKIDLDPEYQRDLVWDTDNKRAFIDSVNRQILPSNFIFNIDTETGNKTCMDGKQRINSILDFYDNKISIDIPDGNSSVVETYFSKLPEKDEDGENADGAEKSRRVFSKKERTDFLNTKISICTFKDLSYSNQVDIFNRVQKGKALSRGELILSIIQNQEVAAEYKKLCSAKEHTLLNFIKNDRKNHFYFVALLMVVIHNNFAGISKANRENFIRKISTKQELKNLFNQSTPS